MTWALLSSGATGFSSLTGGGFTYTLPGGAPPAGALEIICTASNSSVSSVSAGGGAAWIPLNGYSNFESAASWYRVTNGSEGTTIAIVSAASANASSVHFQRWTGATGSSPLDVNPAATGTHTSNETDSTPTLASGTMSTTGELLVAFGGIWISHPTVTPSAPVWTGGTVTDDGAGPGNFVASNIGCFTWGAYNTNAGTASVTCQVTWTGGAGTGSDRAVLIASFKPFIPAPPFTAFMSSM